MSTTFTDAAETRYTPYSIYSLPNEVVGEIMSHISMGDAVKWKQNGEERKLSQFVVLTQVCRSFRLTAFESDGLRDWKFDFCRLIPDSSRIAEENVDDPKTIFRLARLLHAFLADKVFVRALSRKREWTLRLPEVLWAVMGAIPTFHQSTRKVFVQFHYFTDDALSRLSNCQGLTELAIYDFWSDLNLNRISEGFPGLRHLRLVISPNLVGSLHGAKNLISLELARSEDTDGYFRANVLPYASAETLTSLTLKEVPLYSSIVRVLPFQAAFLNLRHLTFTDFDLLSEDLFGFHVLTHLESLTCNLLELPDPAIFSLPALWRLRDLTITNMIQPSSTPAE
jgi:hypothetical protein